MAMLKCSGAMLRGILNSSKRTNALGVVLSCRNYSEVPPDYDFTHLDGPEQIQLLDDKVPMTPEKRAELAAKYNLRPEDYVPLNDSWITMGDYPKLPKENCLERDPHYDWDDPFHRRNYGEPVFHDIDMFTPVVGVDTRPLIYDRRQMWKVLLGFIAGYTFLFCLGAKYKSFLPRAPKQYPEYYPGDEMKEYNYGYDIFEKRGLDAKYKERRPIVNYTFPSEWNPAAH